MRTTVILFLSLLLFGCTGGSSDRIAGNEASAVGSLRVLTSSQAVFLNRDAKGEYGTIKQLGDAQLIDSILASGEKQGYKFKIVVGDKSGKNKEFQFTATADPVVEGKTGNRHFFTDQSGVIRFETGKAATATSPSASGK